MKTVHNCTRGGNYDLSENIGLCTSYQPQSMSEVHTENMTLRRQGQRLWKKLKRFLHHSCYFFKDNNYLCILKKRIGFSLTKQNI